MAGRLNAALAMEEGTARHNTLVQCAKDAAEAGDGDVVLKAIAAISEGAARDNLCAMCSESLAKQGNPSAATAVAKQITNATLFPSNCGKVPAPVRPWSAAG
jgi:hypothetical protein